MSTSGIAGSVAHGARVLHSDGRGGFVDAATGKSFNPGFNLADAGQHTGQTVSDAGRPGLGTIPRSSETAAEPRPQMRIAPERRDEFEQPIESDEARYFAGNSHAVAFHYTPRDLASSGLTTDEYGRKVRPATGLTGYRERSSRIYETVDQNGVRNITNLVVPETVDEPQERPVENRPSNAPASVPAHILTPDRLGERAKQSSPCA